MKRCATLIKEIKIKLCKYELKYKLIKERQWHSKLSTPTKWLNWKDGECQVLARMWNHWDSPIQLGEVWSGITTRKAASVKYHWTYVSPVTRKHMPYYTSTRNACISSPKPTHLSVTTSTINASSKLETIQMPNKCRINEWYIHTVGSIQHWEWMMCSYWQRVNESCKQRWAKRRAKQKITYWTIPFISRLDKPNWLLLQRYLRDFFNLKCIVNSQCCK